MLSKTEKYIKQINSLLGCIEKEQKSLSNKLSNRDKQVSSLYHEIEMTSFNASRGFLLAKQLQKVLRERREIKNELAISQMISRSVNMNDLQIALGDVIKKAEEMKKKQQREEVLKDKKIG